MEDLLAHNYDWTEDGEFRSYVAIFSAASFVATFDISFDWHM